MTPKHQAEGKAMLEVREDWREFEVHRFTWAQHEAGVTRGWRLYAGWFQRASGLRWAWFARPVSNSE